MILTAPVVAFISAHEHEDSYCNSVLEYQRIAETACKVLGFPNVNAIINKEALIIDRYLNRMENFTAPPP